MRCVVQRVERASVTVNGRKGGSIGKGLAVLAAWTHADDERTVDFCVSKIAGLRIFPDGEGKMNLGTAEAGGNVLLISNFTLYGDTRKGRRPSFDSAADPSVSRPLYDLTVAKFRKLFPDLVTGEFGADMKVELVNDGPVTLMVEKENE